MKNLRTQGWANGFTIVELLVVIVVIGILATLTIIGYNGVQQTARDKAVISDVDGVASEVTRYQTKNNGTVGSAVVWYSGNAANPNIKFSPSQGNVVDVVTNTTDYCVRAFNPSSQSYKTLGTAYTKGSTGTACAALPPSNDAIIANPVVNGGVVTTIAGTAGAAGLVNANGSSARFDGPIDVVANAAGNVYVTDRSNRVIRQITPSGDVTTFSGSGTSGYIEGAAGTARYTAPQGMTIDSGGVIYVSDYNRIRKIASDGSTSFLAGSGSYSYAEGTGAAASFNQPYGLAVDSSGNVYVADYGNHRIRKVTSTGVVTTVAGSGTAGSLDGNGTAAQFNYPRGVAVDTAGNLYVVDQNQKVRKITPAGDVSTLAGATYGFADGTGTAARFWNPNNIAIDLSGNLYVSDASNNRIRKVTPAGVVTTVAGNASGGSIDGTGSAARFNYPYGLFVTPGGTIYVAEAATHLIRKIQ